MPGVWPGSAPSRGRRPRPEILPGVRSRGEGHDRREHGRGDRGLGRCGDRHRGRCPRPSGGRGHGRPRRRDLGPGRCAGRQCGRRPRAAGGHQGEHDRSGTPRSRRRHEPLRHRLLLQCRRPADEATAVRQDRHGQLGGRASRPPPTAAMRITVRPRPRSRTTRAIWRRISARTGSPQTALPRGLSPPGGSCRR